MANYPIKFELCPVCGSESRIIETETNEEISKGNLKIGTKIPILATRTIIFVPTEPKILAKRTVPMLMGYFDVCADCGTLYCVEMQKNEGIVEPQFRKGDDGGSPFRGKQ